MTSQNCSSNSNRDLQTRRQGQAPSREREHRYTPQVDIYEEEQGVVLLANMPGVDENNVDVEVEKGVLSIRGRIDYELGEKEEVLSQSFDTGTFYREFSLSDDLEIEGIEASMKNGVLKLNLPKSEKLKARKIQINAGE